MISEIRKHPARIPVVYRDIPLMPMTWKRVKKFQSELKGVVKRTKLGIFYFKLLVKPSGFETQRLIVGMDPGSKFDGVSVVSRKCHLLNLELVHTEKIKDRMDKRRTYRRIRRGRLRHRPIRNEFRNSNKIVPTIRSKLEFRKFILQELLKLFPLTGVVVEDVRFNHFNKTYGKYFSLVEIGKTEFYSYIKEALNLKLKKVSGFQTARNRLKLFGKDDKTKKKDDKSFKAHCLDSYVIGCRKLGLKPNKIKDCQSETIFIKRNWMSRRELIRFKAKVKYKKFYFRYKKGGEVTFFKHFSKLKRIRVKVDENQTSNHGPWDYIYTEPSETFKGFLSNYGGTIAKGQSRSSVARGESKKKCKWGYQNQLWERVVA